MLGRASSRSLPPAASQPPARLNGAEAFCGTRALSITLAGSIERPRAILRGLWRRIILILPEGLYARSALIVIAPMIILQCVLTYVFMERHWQLVTNRLSTVLTQDIAAIIDLHKSFPAATTR